MKNTARAPFFSHGLFLSCALSRRYSPELAKWSIRNFSSITFSARFSGAADSLLADTFWAKLFRVLSATSSLWCSLLLSSPACRLHMNGGKHREEPERYHRVRTREFWSYSRAFCNAERVTRYTVFYKYSRLISCNL